MGRRRSHTYTPSCHRARVRGAGWSRTAVDGASRSKCGRHGRRTSPRAPKRLGNPRPAVSREQALGPKPEASRRAQARRCHLRGQGSDTTPPQLRRGQMRLSGRRRTRRARTEGRGHESALDRTSGSHSLARSSTGSGQVRSAPPNPPPQPLLLDDHELRAPTKHVHGATGIHCANEEARTPRGRQGDAPALPEGSGDVLALAEPTTPQ